MDTSKILNTSEIERIKDLLEDFKNTTDTYYSSLIKLINLFQNQEVVQSFFESGKFGTNSQEKIRDISNAMAKYYNILSNGDNSLFNQTKQYLNDQINLNNSGSIYG